MPFETSVGTTTLPDVGELSYNGADFSSLFKSKVTVTAVEDEARRTVKYLELRIAVSGAVVMNPGDKSIDTSMASLLVALNQQGGVLTYSGRGLGPIVINAPGNPLRDVAWGPVPETIDFQPMGNAGAAMVTWQVTTRIPALRAGALTNIVGQGKGPVIQFNEETTISYDDEDYSSLSIRGTLEIPLTRIKVNNVSVADTVDSYRERFMTKIANSIDESRFRVSRRSFNVSRDKRTMQWEFQAEELPPMGLPTRATHARGTMSVRQAQAGPAFVQWLCSLKCTYTIRKDYPRRYALMHFMALLRFRMNSSIDANIPLAKDNAAKGQNPLFSGDVGRFLGALTIGPALVDTAEKLTRQIPKPPASKIKCLIWNFGFDEGLHLDSKTISFEATWKLFTTLSHLILASGVWEWPKQYIGGPAWAQSVKSVSGWKSWYRNLLDPAGEVIVDMGT